MVFIAFLVTLFVLASNGVAAQLNLAGIQLDLLGLGAQNGDEPTTKAVPIKNERIPTPTEPPCLTSITKLTNSVKVCKGDLIFEDDFNKPFLNRNLWDVEQYIPNTSGPDYEFVSYENSDDVFWVQNGKLIIHPVVRQQESEIRGTLDLKEGCTSKVPTECFHQQISSQIIPPVRSAKISAKFGFTYGKIVIKAKLPKGDWIYPQIQLVPRRNEHSGVKMWIAYSRGNNYYIGRKDEGSKFLIGGVITGSQEQDRTRFTKGRPSLTPYGNATHTYTLIWKPDVVTLLFNDEEYGNILINEDDIRFFPFRREFYVTLGIGVGGVNDFPDSYTSNSKKPWVNFDRKQMKNFFDARKEWLPTWDHGNSMMQIDSVKIYAV